MTERRASGLSFPAHVGVIVGLSTGAYAVTVAGVAGLQSVTETRLAADRAPTVAAIAAMQTAHDGLENRLGHASVAYEEAAAAYQAAGIDVADLGTRLDQLATTVSDVSLSAAALPGAVKIPVVARSAPAARLPSVSGSVPVSAAPPVQATTRASGG